MVLFGAEIDPSIPHSYKEGSEIAWERESGLGATVAELNRGMKGKEID